MIEVLISDGHPLVRKGLGLIVDSSAGMRIVNEASDNSDLMRKVEKDIDYDVLLMDMSKRNGEGIELIKQLKSLSCGRPILIVTVHSQDRDALRMLKAGASGYLTVESTPEELITAIRTVANGKKHISPAIAEQLASCWDIDTEHSPHELLSDREYEVFNRLASGISVKRIADELFLSEKTVSTYRSRVLKKMKMETNCELIRYGFKNGLVE